MNRKDVFELIDDEREYQNDTQADDTAYSVADWVIFIENQVAQAKQEVYNMAPHKALEHVRKIAALAVACMEHNRTESRSI